MKTSHPNSSLTLPANIRHALAALARKHLLVRILRFPLLAAIALPLFWVFTGLIDLVFNLPWGTRLGFFIASLLLAGWFTFRHLIQPLRSRLNTRSAALLVERHFPKYRSALISAVDFTSGEQPVAPASAPLVQQMLGQVERQVQPAEIRREIIQTKPLWKLFGGVIAVLAVVAALVWFGQPQSLILARRVFLSHERFPSRTMVNLLSGDLTVTTGSDVELAARAQGVIPRGGRVIVKYADGRQETVPVQVSATEPGVFRANLRNILKPFRYHFEINDGRSNDASITTQTLPSIAKLRFVYLPPGYTGRPETEIPAGSLTLLAGSRLLIEGESTEPLASATLTLKGLDETLRMDSGDRAGNLRLRLEALEPKVAEKQAEVAKLELEVQTAAKELETARSAAQEARKIMEAAPQGDEKRALGRKFEAAADAQRNAQGVSDRAANQLKRGKDELENWSRQLADLKQQLAGVEAEPAPDAATQAQQKRQLRAVIDIPSEGLSGLSLHLVGQSGLESADDPHYPIRITADKPPVVEVTEPRVERKTLLATDALIMRYKARDDYKLERISLWYVILRPNAEGEAVPEEQKELQLPLELGATTAAGEYAWDLSTFVPPLTEGCSIQYWVEARDHFTLYNPANAGNSRKKILAIVSPEEKKAELLAEMEKAAKEIQRLSIRQGKVNAKTDANLRQ